MADIIKKFTNINFLSKEQYDEITNPAIDELWAVETPAVIETMNNGTSGYLAFSNGLIIQWGKQFAQATSFTVNLLKNYQFTDYNIQCTDTGSVRVSFAASPLSTSQFTVYSGTTNPINVYWYTVGY